MHRRVGMWLARTCVIAAALFPGCSSSARVDRAAQQARATSARSEFTRFGRGRYTVITFAADPEREIEFPDSFDQPLRVYEVPFTGRVRFTAAVDVPRRDEWRTRVGRPGWTVARLIDDAQMALLFGPGARAAGDELDVEGAAMFDRLETGWRFHGLDTVR